VPEINGFVMGIQSKIGTAKDVKIHSRPRTENLTEGEEKRRSAPRKSFTEAMTSAADTEDFMFQRLGSAPSDFRYSPESEDPSFSMFGDYTLSRPRECEIQDRLLLLGRIIRSVEISDCSWS
jgi:hypothetical protein